MFSWMKVAAIVGVTGALMLSTAGAQVLTTPADTTPPAPVLHHSNPNHASKSSTHSKHATKHHKHHKVHSKGHKTHSLNSKTHKAHGTHGWKHHPKNV